MTHLRTVIWTTFFLLLVSSSSFSADRTFRGKVIDAETLKPIEGALVVAIWRKTKAFLITSTTDFKDAKETLTDKNGEWSITGPEGQDVPKEFELLYVIGLRHITGGPEIIYYKPGYKRTGQPGGFSAHPYIDRERNLEGIVLSRPGETWEEIRKHSKQYPHDSLRFIPVKDPEKKLRDLDFSFQYPENLKIIQRRTEWLEADYVVKIDYKVIGLPKAKTREERLKAMRFGTGKELPLASKMEREERERLLGPSRRRAK